MSFPWKSGLFILISMFLGLNSFHANGTTQMQSRIWSCKILHDNMMGILSNSGKLVSGEWVGGRQERGKLFEIRLTAIKRFAEDPNTNRYFALTVEAPSLDYSTFKLGFSISGKPIKSRGVRITPWDVVFHDLVVYTDELFLSGHIEDRNSLSRGGTSLFLSRRGDYWQGSVSNSSVGQKFDLTSATLHFICNDWNLGR